MTDPNAPGNDDLPDDLTEDESGKPPLETDEHESGRGAGRKSNVQPKPEKQPQNPDPKKGSPLGSKRRQ